jgi:hypothetical protein
MHWGLLIELPRTLQERGYVVPLAEAFPELASTGLLRGEAQADVR